MLRVAQVSAKIAILALLVCRTAWADVVAGDNGASAKTDNSVPANDFTAAGAGCASTSPSSLAPFVLLSVVLLHLRRRGRSILEAPKSRIVSRVFVAWPFDGASMDASANDANVEPPVEARSWYWRRRATQTSRRTRLRT